MLGGVAPEPVPDRLHSRLVFDHLAGMMSRNKIYSCPASMVQLVSLHERLVEPATNRPRLDDRPLRMDDDGLDMDEPDPSPDKSRLYFRLVHAGCAGHDFHS